MGTKADLVGDTTMTLLTETEVAAALKVHPRTLRKVRMRGEIAWVRIGRAVRYSPQEVADFVKRATVANTVLPVRANKRSTAKRQAKIIPFTHLAKR